MNALLPEKEELKPILQSNTTFFDCGFDQEFDALPFIKKLQIINDIVRQTILPMINSNPDDELNTLMGNCHTAALVSISYLSSLKIGRNYRYVLGRKRPFDPDDGYSKHALVLVDDDMGNTYEFDATPFCGYGFGTVKLKGNNPLYEEYIPIKNEDLELITQVRYFLYERANNLLDEKKVTHYILIFEKCALKPYLRGFASYGYMLLYKSIFKDNVYAQRAIQINPYVSLNPDKSAINYRDSLIVKQVKAWQEELNSLGSSKDDLQRKLTLGINIVQELKKIDSAKEKYLIYNEQSIPISFLNPRFFYESGLNVIVIKASAYNVGVRSTIREAFLKKGNGAIGEYFTNLATPTKDTGLKPVLYSHTLGDIYERSMKGPADIFLINESAQSLYEKKAIIRSELAQNLLYHDVMWNDNDTIFWHPFVTNLVHSTDGPVEAALHYATGFPEHQAMTRFMYPNPRLERARKK